jgi:hypothetical protein
MNDQVGDLESASEALSAVDVLAALMQRHAAWLEALASVGSAAAGGRERLIVAEIALTQLEELAPQAGLLLADALAGHAPEVHDELLRLLSGPPVSIPAVEQEPLAVEAVDDRAEDFVQLELPAMVPPPSVIAQPPELPPAAVALTDAHVARLKASLNGELKPAAVNQERHQHQALQSLRKQLGGVPPRLATRGDVLNLLKQVELSMADSRTWEQLSSRGRRILVEGLAARIRAIQAVHGQMHDLQSQDNVGDRARAVVRELIKQTAPGKIDRLAWGLALKHDSRSTNWLEDARQIQLDLDDELGIAPEPELAPKFNIDDAFRRLREEVATLPAGQLAASIHDLRSSGVAETDRRWVKLLEPRLADLVGDRTLAKVTRAVASALAEQDTADDSVRAIDANWYGFTHTTGKRAVIVGGDGRSERSEAMKTAFQFERLDWPDIPKNGPNKANALIAQVRKGHYQIVICLQPFISHKLTDQLFDIDVPGTKVVLAQGYGMLQVKLALERYLPRPK